MVDTDHCPHLPFLQLLAPPDTVWAHLPQKLAALGPARAEGFSVEALLRCQPIGDQKLGLALDSEMSSWDISSAALAPSVQPSPEAQESGVAD